MGSNKNSLSVKTESLLRYGCLLSLAVWAALQFWHSRFFEYYGDAISYLDMADHFMRGNWAGGINYTWNPFYPMMVAALFRVINPSAFHEFAALKLLNLLIFLGLLFSFEYFLNVWIETYDDQTKRENNIHRLSQSTWIILGHALFAYCFLCLNSISTDTPDMLAAIFLFVAFANFLKILRGQSAFGNFFLFGFMSGIAYLAKNAALPCLIACMPFLFRQRQKTDRFWQKYAVATAVLLVVILPYVMYLSNRAGELMLFPAGKPNYVWFVQAFGAGFYAENDESLRRSLQHPISQLFHKPDVFEFSEPFEATFPPWFDTVYWLKGCKIYLNPSGLIEAVLCNLAYFCLIFFFAFSAVILVTYFIYRGPILSAKSLEANAVLFIPSLLGFAQYLCVVNLIYLNPLFSTRYFGVFIVLLVFATLGSLRIKSTERGLLAFRTGITLACFFILISLTRQITYDMTCEANTHPSEYYQIADELTKLGLHKGDRVARLEHREPLVDWARLSGLRVVVDIPESKEFWDASAARRQEILQSLKKYNVKMVVYFSAPVSLQSKKVLQYDCKSIFQRLKSIAIPDDKTDDLRLSPIDPPVGEGWLQLGKLTCWVHRV